MNYARIIGIIIAILLNLQVNGQSYRITKLEQDDGLIYKSAAGFIQDDRGVIWVANGCGFTRLYGDNGYDQIKSDRFVFQWSNLIDAKTIGENIYWSSSYVHNGIVDYKLYNNYQVIIYNDERELTMTQMSDEFIDKFEYYWSFYYNEKKDSLSIFRHKGTDSLNVSAEMINKGLVIQPRHEVLTNNYWYRMPRTDNFIEDNERNIWYRTAESRIVKIDFESRTVKSYAKVPNMAAILKDGKGSYWISVYPVLGNPNPGVFKMTEDGRLTNYPAEKEARVYLDQQNNPCLLDHNGIYKLNGQTFDTIFQSQNLYDLRFDSKNRIYGKSHENDSTEIFVIDDEKYYPLMKFPEMYLHMEVFYYVDREDVLWIACKDGVYKCIPSDLGVSTDPNTLHAKIPWIPHYIAKNGDSYYSREDGMYVLRKGHLKKLVNEKIQPQAKVGEDDKGNVYFVTGVPDPDDDYGLTFPDLLLSLYKVRPDLTIENTVSGSLIQAVKRESFFRARIRFYNDELFILTDGGVHFKKGNSPFQRAGLDTSFFDYRYCEKSECYGTDFHIYTLAKKVEEGDEVDKYGWGKKYTLKFDFKTKEFVPFSEVSDTLSWEGSQFWSIPGGWLGFAEEGIVVKNEDEYNCYPYDTTVIKGVWKRPVSWVIPLFASDGFIYYTGKGMGILSFNYKTGKFYQKKVKEGLINSDVSSIFFSPDSNYVFASSSFGLQQIERPSINHDGPLKIKKSWDNSVGFNGAWRHEFVGDSILKMWSGDGILYTLDLVGNYRTNNPPTIFLRNVQLNNDTVDWYQFGCDVDHSNYGDIPNNIQLSHDQNQLTFFFQGVSHLDEDLWYEYQLEGVEKEWIRTTNKSVSYPELNPGSYTFKVKAANVVGSSDEVVIHFEIAKPWYQTIFSRISFLLFLVLVVVAYVKWRTTKLQIRQRILEKKVEERTLEVVEQKREAEHQRDMVEEKNREILDSITYAKRLQTAILPPARLVKEWLNDSFIFYKPKDIVAGDFYWMETTKRDGKNIVFFAAADCTGHGVPGAMVSVVCSNALNRSIKEFDIADPGELLDKVAEIVQDSFALSEDTINDGMDIAVCAVDLLERKIWYAGAQNNLYRITDIDTKVDADCKVLQSGNRKLIEYRANKQPVGYYENLEPFETREIQLEPGDCIYLFSDGFADQFGGEKGKKFKYEPFKQLLLDVESKGMDAQKDILDVEFERWKGNLEQVDDVCVIGLRVNGHMRKLFSERELEVIKKIKEGRQSKEIADELHIAKSTVDTHRKRILAKTNLNNAAELIKFCDEHDIL